MHIILTTDELENLARELASLYPDSADAKVVAQHAGITDIGIHAKAITTWNSVIVEACNQQKIVQLIERVRRDYDSSPIINRLSQDLPVRIAQRQIEETKAVDAAWQVIEDNLSQFLSEDRYSQFHALTEKLQRWVNARHYTPEIFEGFIEIIRRMQDELIEGKVSILEVLERTLSGKFIQPHWAVYSVYQTNRNIFQFVLENFRKEIASENATPTVLIPIALFVMNIDEAAELRHGTLLDEFPDAIRTAFDSLLAHLSGGGAADWIEHYGITPQEWRPFSGTQAAESIENLIMKALNRITEYDSSFKPSFVDIRTLNDESNRSVLRTLRQEGCVVIMDSISMHHPLIHRAFYQSNLDAYPNTSVVSIAPINSVFDVVHEMSLIIQLRISDMEFSKRRMYDYEDYGTCEELCDERKFGHWLADRVKKLVGHQAEFQKSIRSYMHKLENT